MEHIELVILGDPVPYKRERINMSAVKRWLYVKMRGNPYRFGPLTYTPSECQTWKRRIAKLLPHKPLLKGKIGVWVTWHRTKQWEDSINKLRPDGDNVLKLLMDAFNETILADDAYAYLQSIQQVFGALVPMLKVTIKVQGTREKPVKWCIAPNPDKELQRRVACLGKK